MINKLKGLLGSYFTTKEISDDIHRKNRLNLEKVFLFSIIFGVTTFISRYLIDHGQYSAALVYYAYYIVMGLIGLLLNKIKNVKYLPTIFCLVGFYLVFLYYFKTVSFTSALIYFFGFIIAVQILINLNPVIFTICILAAEFVILMGVVLKIFHVDINKYDYAENVILVNMLIIYISFWKRHIVLKKYKTEQKILEEEKQSEELLLNVLPERIIEQLKESVGVEPEVFENVSVFFCQVVNYIELSEQLGPESLVNELNEVFSAFDILVDKNSCVRIKTMGEIYMGVCGLPVADHQHAEHSVACVKDFVEYIKRHNEISPAKIIVMAGVSSGSVIAGIVGIKKYIYDIFGDTVNTAYRMKGLSSAMQVKVSPVTYELVKEYFDFVKQNPIEVKGKGLMETYNLSI